MAKLITLLIIASLAFGCTSGGTSIRNIEAEPLDLIRAYRKGFNKIRLVDRNNNNAKTRKIDISQEKIHLNH